MVFHPGFHCKCIFSSSVQFSSVPWLVGSSGGHEEWFSRDPLLSFLLEALVSYSSMGGDVHSLILSIQHFLCWPQHRPSSKVRWRMVLERLSWHVTCPNHASFFLLTVAKRGSCGPKRKLILPCAQSLVLCSKLEMQRRFPIHLVLKAWIIF